MVQTSMAAVGIIDYYLVLTGWMHNRRQLKCRLCLLREIDDALMITVKLTQRWTLSKLSDKYRHGWLPRCSQSRYNVCGVTGSINRLRCCLVLTCEIFSYTKSM